MSTDNPTPAPTPQWKQAAQWLWRNREFLAWAVATLSLLATTYLGCKPLPPVPLPPDVNFERSFGWQDDPETVDAVATRAGFPEFAMTPAGQAVMDKPPSHVSLWKAVGKQWSQYQGNDGRPYPAENQRNVGCCVGCGTKHAADATQAIEIELGGRHEWQPLAIEPIYAAGRVEVGKGQIRGDGSIGAWSAKAATDHGFAPMAKIDRYDLTKFDPMRARAWGKSGAPEPVKAKQAQHRMGNAARVRSWEECKKALAQGYAIFLCSDVGFEGRKDSEGFIRANGVWPHCMALLGYQTGRREGGLILNSWGPEAHAGPAGWGEPPAGSFWADASTIDRMCRSGDCWCLSSFQGFPARTLDWTVYARPPARRDRFGMSPFAVAP